MFRTILTVLAFSVVASATSVTFLTPAGSQDTALETVNAKAVITTGAGFVTVDLFNLLAATDMNSAGQNLSDLSFTLSGAFPGLAVTDADRTYTGKLIDLSTTGVVSTDAGDGLAASYNRWFFTNSGSVFLLEDLGVGMPSQTIIGGTPGVTTSYPNANSSLTGSSKSSPHEPEIQGVAHFTLNITGVTADTNITGATFSFGTDLGDNINGCIAAPGAASCRLSTVPEPVSATLLGTGLLSLCCFLLRRRATR